MFSFASLVPSCFFSMICRPWEENKWTARLFGEYLTFTLGRVLVSFTLWNDVMTLENLKLLYRVQKKVFISYLSQIWLILLAKWKVNRCPTYHCTAVFAFHSGAPLCDHRQADTQVWCICVFPSLWSFVWLWILMLYTLSLVVHSWCSCILTFPLANQCWYCA